MWRARRALRTCRDLVRNADAIRDHGGLPTKAPGLRSSWEPHGTGEKRKKHPRYVGPRRGVFGL